MYLYIIVPKGFFPQQDTGRLGGTTRAAQDISFPAMRVKQQELAQKVLEDPSIQSVTAFVGGGGPGGGSSNVGRMFIALKPLNQRPNRVSADQVVNGLRRKLTSVPGATLFLQAQQDIQIGGRGSDAQYQYTLSTENLSDLNTWAPRLQAKMREMPELKDVSSDQQNQGLAANLVIDRDTASRLGISMQAIDQVLYDAFGQRQVSTMYTGLNQYFVVMEVDPQYQIGKSPRPSNHSWWWSTIVAASRSAPACSRTTWPIFGCSAMTRHSGSSSSLGLVRIASGMASLPRSWRRLATRMRSSSGPSGRAHGRARSPHSAIIDDGLPVQPARSPRAAVRDSVAAPMAARPTSTARSRALGAMAARLMRPSSSISWNTKT